MIIPRTKHAFDQAIEGKRECLHSQRILNAGPWRTVAHGPGSIGLRNTQKMFKPGSRSRTPTGKLVTRVPTAKYLDDVSSEGSPISISRPASVMATALVSPPLHSASTSSISAFSSNVNPQLPATLPALHIASRNISRTSTPPAAWSTDHVRVSSPMYLPLASNAGCSLMHAQEELPSDRSDRGIFVLLPDSDDTDNLRIVPTEGDTPAVCPLVNHGRHNMKERARQLQSLNKQKVEQVDNTTTARTPRPKKPPRSFPEKRPLYYLEGVTGYDCVQHRPSAGLYGCRVFSSGASTVHDKTRPWSRMSTDHASRSYEQTTDTRTDHMSRTLTPVQSTLSSSSIGPLIQASTCTISFPQHESHDAINIASSDDQPPERASFRVPSRLQVNTGRPNTGLSRLPNWRMESGTPTPWPGTPATVLSALKPWPGTPFQNRRTHPAMTTFQADLTGDMDLFLGSGRSVASARSTRNVKNIAQRNALMQSTHKVLLPTVSTVQAVAYSEKSDNPLSVAPVVIRSVIKEDRHGADDLCNKNTSVNSIRSGCITTTPMISHLESANFTPSKSRDHVRLPGTSGFSCHLKVIKSSEVNLRIQSWESGPGEKSEEPYPDSIKPMRASKNLKASMHEARKGGIFRTLKPKGSLMVRKWYTRENTPEFGGATLTDMRDSDHFPRSASVGAHFNRRNDSDPNPWTSENWSVDPPKEHAAHDIIRDPAFPRPATASGAVGETIDLASQEVVGSAIKPSSRERQTETRAREREREADPPSRPTSAASRLTSSRPPSRPASSTFSRPHSCTDSPSRAAERLIEHGRQSPMAPSTISVEIVSRSDCSNEVSLRPSSALSRNGSDLLTSQESCASPVSPVSTSESPIATISVRVNRTASK